MHIIRRAELAPGESLNKLPAPQRDVGVTSQPVRGRALIFWDPKLAGTKYGRKLDPCCDDPDPETLKPDRDRDIKATEFVTKLLLSAKTDRVRHMRASIAIAVLKSNLNLSDIARHFKVTPERVTQVVKDVKGYEVSE